MSASTLFRHLWAPARRTPRERLRPRARPRVEVLEDRVVLSAVITVTDPGDSGAGTLRSAIAQANSDNANDKIAFAPNLNRATITLGSSNNSLNLGFSAFEIKAPMTIVGSGQTLQVQTGFNFRLFAVGAGVNKFTLQNLTLTGGNFGNVDTDNGGAIYNAGTLEIDNCLLTGNSALSNGGGALFNAAGATAALTNTTLVANKAQRGGGVYNYGTVTLTNCTVTGNSITGPNAFGAGVRTYAQAGTTATTTLINTIVAGNTGGNDTDIDEAATGTATLDASRNNIIQNPGNPLDGATFNKNWLIQADPQLGPLQNNGGFTMTMAPGPQSPALKAGTPTGAPLTDARGAVRDNPPDIGAYEVNHPLAPVGVPTDLYSLYGPHPSGSTDEAFVKGLYNATFQRSADSSGLAYWLGQLNSGAMTPAQVAQQFFNSDENRNDQVGFFYTYFLQRSDAADPSGLAYWRQQLQSGAMNELQVMTGFILSPEYTAKEDNAGFLTTIYFGLLGRNPDGSGFNYWKGQLDSGAMMRQQVLAFFLNSTEGLNRLISDYYGAYLERLPSSSELTSASGAVQQGQMSLDAVAVSLLSSTEFVNNAANNTGP
jgi:hypothetical protein